MIFTTDQDPPHRGWEYATSLRATRTGSISAAVSTSPATDDNFGSSVSMPNKNTILVGAGQYSFNDALGNEEGAVYVFTGEGANWTETQRVTYSGAQISDNHGGYNRLAATQKEIFVGGTDLTANPEKVIRYRI